MGEILRPGKSTATSAMNADSTAQSSCCRALCLLLCLACLLTGCQSALLQDSAPASAEPAANSTSADPAETFDSFMRAWAAQDFEAMYRLIARRSRELTSQADFNEQYSAAHSVIRFGGLTYELGAVDYQGGTAIVTYDILLDSPAFGAIADQNRVMRLVEDDGWKVAWSSMDIFSGMTASARLSERAEFPRRAGIFAADGRMLARDDGTLYSLYAVKDDMANVDACLTTLAEVTRERITVLAAAFADYLGETRFHIAELDSDRYQRYRGRLAADCAIEASAGAFSKVRSYRARSYYGSGIATHLVGYIGTVPADALERWQALGYSAGDLIGRAGIELSYEATLAGRPQRHLRIVEGGSTVIRELSGADGEPPRAVTLTINRDLQEIMAQALAEAVSAATPNWGGLTAGGALAALDVNSGALLALASYPSFNPQLFNPRTEYNVAAAVTRLNNDPRNPFVNKALAEQYTPGSVYKIVTALAAASAGIWDARRQFECGYVWRGGDRFGDARPQRHDWRILEEPPRPPAGTLTMAGALAASCNPFFYEMGALMFERDPALQSNYAVMLGFGAATGLRDLGIEAPGDVAPPTEVTQAINNAIGQGSVGVTVLQMAQLTALIANGGNLWQPYVVSHIGSESGGDFRQIQQPSLKAALEIDADALAIARDGMCQVTTVEDLGTAEFVFQNAEVPAAYSLCGKTGTAETLGNPHAWFVAYYPRENPEIAFAGVMAHSREGSEVVAPIIRRILDDYLGAPRNPFPEWWGNSYVPLKSQEQALADLAAGAG